MPLEQELINLIKEVCDAEEKPWTTEDNQKPLVGPESALGLDSLDALEITVEVEKRYNVKINNQNTALQVLNTLNTLADFIRKNQTV